MASSYKTPFLKLNSFVGTDKPKMDDFNYDNQVLDEAVKKHVQNMHLHVSEEEKKRWNSGAFVLGSYVGDETIKREIPLGFKPRLCIVFQQGAPLVNLGSQGGTDAYSAVISSCGETQFVGICEQGFWVEHMNVTAPVGATPRLNQQGKTYVYVAYK